MTYSSATQAFGLAVAVVVCFGAAAIGGAATTQGLAEWYDTLSKPAWNPPNWIFAPVWFVLYLLMSTSVWLVWRKAAIGVVTLPIACFGVQLVLNSFWSVMFFGMRQPGWAAIEIVVLWLAIAATMWLFRKHSSLAAGLLIPYLLWVSFASVLNITIWSMNRVG